MLPGLFSSPLKMFVGPVFSLLHTAQRQHASQASAPRKRRITATRVPVDKASGSSVGGSILGFGVAVLDVSNGVKTLQYLRCKMICAYLIVARLT